MKICNSPGDLNDDADETKSLRTMTCSVILLSEQTHRDIVTPMHERQCFLIQKQTKCFLDTLIRIIFFWIMKTINFRGYLTDTSAKKEVLMNVFEFGFTKVFHDSLLYSVHLG